MTTQTENDLKVFENFTGPAFKAARAALTAYDNAGGKLQKALTRAMAAILAAEPEHTPKSASKMLADKVKGATEGSANVMRSRARKAFEHGSHLADLRRMVTPHMTPGDFAAALEAFCESFDVRKIEAERNPTPAAAPKRKVEAGQTVTAPEVEANKAAALDNQTVASRAIAALIADGAWDALDVLATQISVALLARDEEMKKAA